MCRSGSCRRLCTQEALAAPANDAALKLGPFCSISSSRPDIFRGDGGGAVGMLRHSRSAACRPRASRAPPWAAGPNRRLPAAAAGAGHTFPKRGAYSSGAAARWPTSRPQPQPPGGRPSCLRRPPQKSRRWIVGTGWWGDPTGETCVRVELGAPMRRRLRRHRSCRFRTRAM